jgi:uncharacterized protein
MLRLDLARLEREGSVQIRADVPAADPLWEGSGLAFASPLSVNLRAQAAGSGEIVVRGRVEGVLESECRLCLEPVSTEVEEDLILVYAPEDLLSGEEADVRPIPARARELDLGEAIREELILSLDPFVLCDPECKGLCPRCGVNRNQQPCECVGEELDPRWDVLRRALKNE